MLVTYGTDGLFVNEPPEQLRLPCRRRVVALQTSDRQSGALVYRQRFKSR